MNNPMDNPNFKHWTAHSIQNYRFAVAANFIVQLEERLDALKISRAEFAEKMGVTPGRVSQIINNPGNLKLESAIQYAQALGLRVSLIAYDDQAGNKHAPVNPEIFTRCWEKQGRPLDFFELGDADESLEG